MKVRVDLKVCGVCGDKALGCNFNAVTCESCKAFFRRNALIQKEFKCPFNNQCDITKITRRFCQKCRLDKCFSMGMRKDLIMTEKDKVAKRQKIEDNKAKKRSMGGFKSGFKKIKRESVEPDSQESEFCNTDSDSKDTTLSCQGNEHNTVISVISYNNAEPTRITNDDTSSTTERLVSSSDDVSVINNILNLNSVDKDRACFITLNNNDLTCNNNTSSSSIYSNDPECTSSSLITDITRDVVRDIDRIQSLESNSMEAVLCEAIKLEYEAFSSITQYPTNSRELNDAERAKLNELIVANKALLTPIDEELKNLIGEEDKFQGTTRNPEETDPELLDIINLTAIGIRRLIKMSKRINAFKNMCQEDQVALLKGGCTEIMLLRSCLNYDHKKKIWQIPHSIELKVNTNVLKQAKGNIFQVHETFIKTFDAKWREDENIVLILCAVVLFTPTRPKVVHQDVIKLEQNSYYYLLRRYLESIYSGCEAKSTFLKLIKKISELHKLNEELINVFLEVNPSQVEPLLKEIFDLKN